MLRLLRQREKFGDFNVRKLNDAIITATDEGMGGKLIFWIWRVTVALVIVVVGMAKSHCSPSSSSFSLWIATDAGIGNITDALVSLGYEAEDLLLFFTTDNGGKPSLGSSNWPLRGGKSTLWEGGTRAVSFLHSKNLLPNAPYTWDGLVHAVDW